MSTFNETVSLPPLPPPPPSPPLVQIGSLCTSDCSETQCVDQLGFKLKRPLGSTSQALGLKVCTTKALVRYLFFYLDTSYFHISSQESPPFHFRQGMNTFEKQVPETYSYSSSFLR